MSAAAPSSSRPQRSAAEEAPPQTQPCTYSNKNQSWYRNLCRPGESPTPVEEDHKQVYPSPQRLQLQLHFQREYQQRQELQKNCRQDWWQKTSAGPAYAASPSPCCGYRTPSPSPGYRTPSPSPAHKFHAAAGAAAAAPAYYQSGPYPYQHQATPRHAPPAYAAAAQQSAQGYYPPGARAGDPRAASSENRRRVERDLVDREREKMIRTAQVIKLDAEKRIRQLASASSGEQDNTQRLLIQLLKEQDLAQKLQAGNRAPPPTPVTPVQHLSADLQYRLATLLQAYQPAQQMSAGYQRRWQEQIATYKGMLQEYRHGNFYQSHQKAKRLLQLLLHKEQASAQARLPPPYYGPPPQHPAVYPAQHAQPLFRTPLPLYASRSRRDPRLNRSSQPYQTPTYDVTPRLNQSSCQYSEQDLTSEIIYQGESPAQADDIARRNSTPRKQAEDGPAAPVGDDARSEEAPKLESQQPAKAAADCQPQKDQQPVEVPEDRGIAETSTQTADDEHYGSEHVPGSKEQQHDWEQLQQRSRRHRRGRFRRSSEDGMESVQRKPVNGAHGEEPSAAPPGSRARHVTGDPELHRNTGMKHNDVTPSNGESGSFPDNEAQQKTLKDPSGSGVRAGTPFKASNNAGHRAEIINTDIRQTTVPNNQSVLSDEIWTDQINQTCVEGRMSKSNSRDRIPEMTNRSVTDSHRKSTDKENKGKIVNGNETAAHEQDLLPSRPESPKSTHDAYTKSSAAVSGKDPSLEKKAGTEKDPKESDCSPGQAISEKAQPADDRAKVKCRRQLSEPLQSRTKQHPAPQTRPHPPLQRQSSRGSQIPCRDPQSQRPTRPQPPPRAAQQTTQPSPRAARQTTPGSRQSSEILHQVSDSRPPTQTSQKPAEVRPAPTETRIASTGTKSSESAIPKSQSLDSMAGKSDGAKSQGGAASKPAGGRRSPGNTYVIRNSGQRFASRPPPGGATRPQDSGSSHSKHPSPKSDASKSPPGGATRHQDSGSSHSKNPSPKSDASKSPPEDAGKPKVSPPSAKSRRRRYRRKPWSREDDSFHETSRSSSAPHGQPRYQDRQRDHGQQAAWLSPSPGRWSGPRYSHWDAQPRRRPYQWDDARTVPAKKWRDVVHHGDASPPTGSSNAEQPRGGRLGPKSRASPEPRKPTPEKGRRAADSDLHAESEEQNPYDDSDIEEPTAEDGAQEMPEQTSAAARQDSDGGGKRQSEETTKPREIEAGHEKRPSETTQKMNDAEGGGRGEADGDTLQAGPALQHGASGVSEGSTSSDTEPVCGKGTPMEPPAAAGDIEEPRRVVREKPETLLEHVLAVLGRKAARDALEEEEEEGAAEEGEDGAAPLQTLHSPKSEHISGTLDATESTTQTSPVTFHARVNESSQEQTLPRDDEHVDRAADPRQADDGVSGDVGPSSPGGVTPEAAANDQTTQTDISLASATLSPAFLTPCAKLVRLEDMEDWRSLDDQQKDQPCVGEPPGHQQETSVGDDQPRPTTAGQELTTRTTDGPSSENRHLRSDSQTATSEETRLGRGGGDGGNLCQEEHKTADVESSNRSGKTEARQPSGVETSTSLPGENDVGSATRHDDGEGTQKPDDVSERETGTPSATHVGLTEEGGEAPEENAGLHEPSGKQDGLSVEDKVGIATPRSGPLEDKVGIATPRSGPLEDKVGIATSRSGPLEEIGDAVETSKEVSASESEPESVKINEVLVETANTLPADCPCDIEKDECAMASQQPETSQTEELKPFESHALHNECAMGNQQPETSQTEELKPFESHALHNECAMGSQQPETSQTEELKPFESHALHNECAMGSQQPETSQTEELKPFESHALHNECAMGSQQPETSETEELKPFESHPLHSQSSPDRHRSSGDREESLTSVCEEHNPQSPTGIDRESVAPDNEPACSEAAGDENSPSKNWRVVKNQPGGESTGPVSSTCSPERCVQETAATCPPERCVQETAATCPPERCVQETAATCPPERCVQETAATCPPDRCVQETAATCPPDRCVQETAATCPPERCVQETAATCPPERCVQETAATCPPERCVQETAAAVGPLSALAHSAAVKFSSLDSLCPGPETDLTRSEDSGDRNKSTACAISSAASAEDDPDLHESQVVCGASSPGSPDSECLTVRGARGHALCKSTLMDRERRLTSSGKKKSVSFLLDRGSWDGDEGLAARWEGHEPSGVVMKSPPADKTFNWEGDGELVVVPAMAGVCPVCSRPLAPEKQGNIHLASGEVLFDKLTACGYF